MIDGVFLLDLGPDSPGAALAFGEDFSRVRYLAQTHSHSDHFDPGHMVTRVADYACLDAECLTVFASRKCAVHMSEKLEREEQGTSLMTQSGCDRLNAQWIEMSHGSCISFDGYQLIALESAHDTSDGSLLYIIRKGETAFLYACDTPTITERAWAMLESLDFNITAAAVDQCYGPLARGGGHMCAEEVASFVKRLGCPAVYATHISHEGTPTHDDLEAWTLSRGYHTAYDGLRLTLP